MKRYKVGILGSGVISRTYVADIQAFYKDLEVIACADIDVGVAQKLSDEFGISKVYVTEELLADKEIEIVINLTPPQFHVELNKKILEAGKHLFSEKPFATNIKDADEVLSLAEKKGLMVGCAPDTFLASGIQSMRYYLDAGMIGKPFFVTMNMTDFGAETWHPNPAPFYRKSGGPLFDMAPYYLSALVSLMGPIESIASFQTGGDAKRHVYVGKNAGTDIKPEVKTHCSAILRLANGIVANFNISRDIYRSELPAFEIYGDAGTLSYPDPNFGGGTPKIYRKEQYTDPVYNHSPEAAERKERFYELPELYPRFKDYSRGIGVLDLAYAIETGKKNRANGELIIHITEAIEGLIKSSETGEFYKMETTCERPEPLKAGKSIEEIW